MTEDKWLEANRHVPELYRARAQTNASLVATGAAALAAGAVFGGAENLNVVGRLAALFAVVLLLVSVVLFVFAASHVDDSDVSREEAEAALRGIVETIRKRGKCAAIAAIAAVVAFVVVVGSTVVPRSSQVRATVVLSDEAASALDVECSVGTNGVLVGMIDESSASDLGAFLEITVARGACDKHEVDLSVPSSGIQLLRVD